MQERRPERAPGSRKARGAVVTASPGRGEQERRVGWGHGLEGLAQSSNLRRVGLVPNRRCPPSCAAWTEPWDVGPTRAGRAVSGVCLPSRRR